VTLAADGGVDYVQLRDKTASARALYDLAAELQAVLDGRAKLAVNDRLDVALAIGANAIHLAGNSLPVRETVRQANQRLTVGRSVHSLAEARSAADEGADYVTFGHIFDSASKPGLAPRGLDELARIVDGVGVPVLAIGGISAANVSQVLATRCAGVAVISAILFASSPRQAAANLRLALNASPYAPRNPFVQELSPCASS